ncbi:unnamed protein product [Linum tenue]|uniref:Uncharacterized protein n=1 Tax=Linum tenue TaxID=586396 RepID=A0AAV0KEL5_9ROSI|nr:unnamed protein product [Linum tenue]
MESRTIATATTTSSRCWSPPSSLRRDVATQLQPTSLHSVPSRPRKPPPSTPSRRDHLRSAPRRRATSQPASRRPSPSVPKDDPESSKRRPYISSSSVRLQAQPATAAKVRNMEGSSSWFTMLLWWMRRKGVSM